MKKIAKRILSLIMVCCCFFTVTACNKKDNSSTTSISDKQQICTHSYTSEVTKAATCKETGLKTYTCTICGGSYIEEIAVDPYAHNGKYECSICYKNYQDCISQYVFEHGMEGELGLKYYSLTYDYYSEDEHHYLLHMEVTATTVYFLLEENYNSCIGIWLDLRDRHRLIIAGEYYDLLNPEIVTPTLNIIRRIYV